MGKPCCIVPKPSGDIRLCVDMRRAKQAIVREHHPIPTVDNVLYQLNGSTVFSKLNLRWDFYQIEFEEQSGKITTFITHKGLFRYNRLMFGISSAPELYQHAIQQVLEGCEGAYNIHDNIIIYSPFRSCHHVLCPHCILGPFGGSAFTRNFKFSDKEVNQSTVY